MASSNAFSQRRTVNYPWVALVACVTLVLGWAASAAISYVTESSGSLSWLTVPMATVVTTLITAFATAHLKIYEPESKGTPTSAPASAARRPMPFAASALLVALIVGLVGLGLTFGVRYAYGWFTGNEPGVERLAEPKSQTDKGLTLAVDSIEHTRHFTRVTAEATNHVGNPVTLNLFHNAVLQGGDGTTIDADPFRSSWVEELAPGAKQRGVIVFTGHLPDDVRFARLSFSHVYESGFDGPDSIAVIGMRIRAP